MVVTSAHSQVVIRRVGGALVVTASASTHKIGTSVRGMVALGRDDDLFNVFFLPVGVIATIGRGRGVHPLEA